MLCSHCGSTLPTNRKKWCSDSCQTYAWRSNNPSYMDEYRRTNAIKLASEAQQWRNKNPEKCMLIGAKKRAKTKNIDFSLTPKDVSIPDVCPVLGIPMFKGTQKMGHNSPSLDRIDNTRGYVKGNVRVISWRANNLKGDATLDELRALVAYMETNKTEEPDSL